MDSFLPSLYCFTEWAEWLLATVLVNRLIVVSLCRYSYMIDNIILLITGTLHQRQIAELRSKCHPLGSFEEMESVNIANTPAELYEAVLVDTPLGKGGGGEGRGRRITSLTGISFVPSAPYFKGCISQTDLDELNIEIIRNKLYKVCVCCVMCSQCSCVSGLFSWLRLTLRTSTSSANSWEGQQQTSWEVYCRCAIYSDWCILFHTTGFSLLV